MIGILADAHGNRPGFERALDLLRREGARRFVFLGDAVGYIPTAAVVAAIAELGTAIVCVRGNHDEMVLSNTTDPAREHVYQHVKTREALSRAALALMGGWDVRYTLESPAGRALFVHGSPSDPTAGYVYPAADLRPLRVDADFVFMGHTHRPFVRRCDRTLFVNVGSCGLPRDHGGLGAAALFDDSTGDVRILRFDIARETRELCESVAGVHPSVLRLLERRGDTGGR